MAWEIKETLSYYRSQGAPGDQNVLVQLLREIQRENRGSIPVFTVKEIVREYGIKEGIVLSLIKRVPSLRLGSGHCLELCAGPNCGKHTALAEDARKLQKKSKMEFELKFVPCMRMCGKGPNVRWDGELYHKATKELLAELIK